MKRVPPKAKKKSKTKKSSAIRSLRGKYKHLDLKGSAKMTSLALAKNDEGGDDPFHKIYGAIERFISNVPETDEGKSKKPKDRARLIVNTAAAKAALISAGLALPPGPLGIMTIIPDLLAIWRLQAQMVADIAGTFGKEAFLTREQMLYCLFRHAAAQAVRDLVVRTGERVLVQRVSLRAIQQVIKRSFRVLPNGLSEGRFLVGFRSLAV